MRRAANQDVGTCSLRRACSACPTHSMMRRSRRACPFSASWCGFVAKCSTRSQRSQSGVAVPTPASSPLRPWASSYRELHARVPAPRSRSRCGLGDWSRTRDGEALRVLPVRLKTTTVSPGLAAVCAQSSASFLVELRKDGPAGFLRFDVPASDHVRLDDPTIHRTLTCLPILRSAELPIRCGSAQRKKSEPGGPSDVKQFTGNSKFPLSA